MVVQHLNKEFRDMSEKYGALDVVKKAGGSVLESPTLFSSSGKNLFVACGTSVHSYNVETAELVTIYKGLNEEVVGMCLHPGDPNKLIAVSCVGEYIEWDCSSRGSFIRKFQLGENDGQVQVLYFSLVPQDDGSLCVVCTAVVPEKKYAVVRTFCSVTGKEKDIYKGERVDKNNRSLAVRHRNGETLLAGFLNKTMPTLFFFISCGESGVERRQATCNRRFACVACHPTELCVITGDLVGCVKVWKNFLLRTLWAPYHWHHLPVKTVAFSYSGGYFYSGGNECVLVKWQTESSAHNKFLPRLPSEIVHLAVSPDNTYVAVSTSDNAIQLVGADWTVARSIQHFSWSIPHAPKCMFTVEMTNDPRTKALVTNGRSGHMQFFSVDQGDLLYLLDIVSRNYLSQERFKVIKNTELVKFAFSADGSWMASVEYCEEEKRVPMELRLKFWEYCKVKQTYVLNTSIENPHRGKVNAVQFHPSANNETLICVTTGEDGKFRTWRLGENPNIYSKGNVWSSEVIGFYRDLPVGALSFSNDGSLMAIAFGPTLTVWEPVSNQLKCSLTRPDTMERLSHVEFGRISCGHLIITGSRIGIAVWNLLSLSLLWVVHFNLTILVSDPLSETMAAFSDKNDVVIFSPNCPDPVFKQNSLVPVKQSILNAIFVPHSHQKNSNVLWQSRSQLYFISSKQELFCLEHSTPNAELEEGRKLDILPTESFRPKTPYASILAQQSQSDVVAQTTKLHRHLGIPGFKTLQQLLMAPAHAMPPLSLVGSSLLLSFISRDDRSDDIQARFRIPKDKMEIKEDSDAEEDDDDEDSKEDVQPSTSNLEELKRNLVSKHQSTETPSKQADTLQSLVQIQKKSLDWVSHLLK